MAVAGKKGGRPATAWREAYLKAIYIIYPVPYNVNYEVPFLIIYTSTEHCYAVYAYSCTVSSLQCKVDVYA